MILISIRSRSSRELGARTASLGTVPWRYLNGGATRPRSSCFNPSMTYTSDLAGVEPRRLHHSPIRPPARFRFGLLQVLVQDALSYKGIGRA